jgi:hypothetical protein
MGTKKIYQFKVVLKKTKPPIWRRIQISGNSSFWDLHTAIQDAMGWSDTHLHEFEVFNFRQRHDEFIGVPYDAYPSNRQTSPEWEIPLSRYFTSSNRRAHYTYDFGDQWVHLVTLEKTSQPEPGKKYPRCVTGRRKCPPENCGGPWGYDNLLSIQHTKSMQRCWNGLEGVSTRMISIYRRSRLIRRRII